jgi:hypothetical protein
MTTMSSRKELFHVISEMCNEMRKKLDTDFENVSVDGWMVCWQVVPPIPDDEEQLSKSPSTKRSTVHNLAKEDDDRDGVRFCGGATCGFKFGTERLRIETSYEKYKYITILTLSSLAEGKQTALRTDIKWYDRLRPTWWKLNRTIKYARKVRVNHQALAIEKDLAKIIPNRIDDILLGGKNAKT